MNIVAEINRNPIQMDARGRMICRFYQRGVCRFGARCRNSHGEAVTVTTESPKQQNQNRNGVRPKNESRNQTALASDSSANSSTAQTSSITGSKSCGICLEVVKEKPKVKDRTFGILADCNHCFCFVCIQEWRKNKEVASEASKSCPECRTPVNYVYHSKIWFDNKEEKDSFITKKKDLMKNVDCRYFKKGTGVCRLGNTCMYRHALSNGTKVDLGPPRVQSRNFNNLFDDLLENVIDSDLDFDSDEYNYDSYQYNYDSDESNVSYASHLGMYYEDLTTRFDGLDSD